MLRLPVISPTAITVPVSSLTSTGLAGPMLLDPPEPSHADPSRAELFTESWTSMVPVMVNSFGPELRAAHTATGTTIARMTTRTASPIVIRRDRRGGGGSGGAVQPCGGADQPGPGPGPWPGDGGG